VWIRSKSKETKIGRGWCHAAIFGRLYLHEMHTNLKVSSPTIYTKYLVIKTAKKTKY
jgi:hypothetical protein